MVHDESAPPGESFRNSREKLIMHANSKENFRVVVSGLGIVCAIGRHAQEVRKSLEVGMSGISRVEAFDVSGFGIHSAGEIKDLSDAYNRFGRPKDRVDRASVLALEAARQAIEDSGLVLAREGNRAIGVSVGTCSGGYLNGLGYLTQRVVEGKVKARRLLDLPLHAAASRICNQYQLLGPVNVVSNACASSAIAIAWGFEQIRSGQTRAMVVGGYDALTPMNLGGFSAMRNSSLTNTIRPFDRKRDGVLLGEGSAIFVLERREDCLKRGARIWAEILGYGVNSDAYHFTAPDPSGGGAVGVMKLALEDAGMNTADVDYINAHGTATLPNDLMETLAIKRVFGERAYHIPVSSTKSMLGHTLGAAGAVELAASILAMNHNFFPPTINYEHPDPKCDLDYIPNSSRKGRIIKMLSNSFGFGGTNCCLALGKAEV